MIKRTKSKRPQKLTKYVQMVDTKTTKHIKQPTNNEPKIQNITDVAKEETSNIPKSNHHEDCRKIFHLIHWLVLHNPV